MRKRLRMASSMYKKYKVEYTYTKRGDYQLYFMDNGEAIKIGNTYC